MLRPGLKTGVRNNIFWSEIGSGFGDAGGTPPPTIPRSTPPGHLHPANFKTLTGCLSFRHSNAVEEGKERMGEGGRNEEVASSKTKKTN